MLTELEMCQKVLLMFVQSPVEVCDLTGTRFVYSVYKSN